MNERQEILLKAANFEKAAEELAECKTPRAETLRSECLVSARQLREWAAALDTPPDVALAAAKAAYDTACRTCDDDAIERTGRELRRVERWVRGKVCTTRAG